MTPSSQIDGAAAVAAQSAQTLRALAEKNASLTAENKMLHDKVASYERSERVRTLAQEMDDKGLSPELTFSDKIASISRYPDLDQVESAIKLAGAGRLDLAAVTEDADLANPPSGAGAFANFCVTGQSNS